MFNQLCAVFSGEKIERKMVLKISFDRINSKGGWSFMRTNNFSNNSLEGNEITKPVTVYRREKSCQRHLGAFVQSKHICRQKCPKSTEYNIPMEYNQQYEDKKIRYDKNSSSYCCLCTLYFVLSFNRIEACS